MLQIEELTLEHEDAFLKMMADFEKSDPAWLRFRYGGANGKWDGVRFKKYVKECESQRMDWRPGPKRTSVSRYVMPAANGQILATGWMQFPLNEITEVDGGNLICDVPPSLRRQGHGSVCLSLLLFEAVRAGLRRALVTCPVTDRGARRIIEMNRGEFSDEVSSTDSFRAGIKIARYWIKFQ